MSHRNTNNVYKGPDALRDYFNPDISPPLPLVELPKSLNPYYDDGVHIYGKMMSMHPANNVKAMPALNLLQYKVDPSKTDTVVEYSSGSTVISMILASKVLHGSSNVHAFLSNKTSSTKLKLMRFFGLNLTLFGGPSQPEPLDERGGIRAAYNWAKENENVVNPDQYGNDLNWKSHVRWTGPQIFLQLPEINVICAGMGTSGTMSGLGMYFKENKPSVYRLGVCTKAGDRVPGPRSLALLRPVEFPWRDAVDGIEEVGSRDSYTLSLQLCRHGILCGPSSGFNLQGLFQMLQKRRDAGTLSELAGADGKVHCVIICCDLPYQYIDEYFEKVGHDQFPSIKHQELTKVDLYRYDEVWEKDASKVLAEFFCLDEALAWDILYFLCNKHSSSRSGWKQIITPKPDTIIVDLRQPEDFEGFNLPGSVNCPLVSADARHPFADPSMLASLWRKLDSVLGEKNAAFSSQLEGKHTLVLCYQGDSSRVATSVLRAKGYSADSMRGGIEAFYNECPVQPRRDSAIMNLEVDQP